MLRAISNVVIALSVFGAAAYAQQPDFPGPEKEHAFLKKFAGRWKTNTECRLGPDLPPMKTTSTTNARMIGEFWVVSEVTGKAMGQPMAAIQTIGYDATKKSYVGTWVDSMMGHLWSYNGSVDETGSVLTLEAVGPNFMTGEGTTVYREIYEFETDDHIRLTAFVKDAEDKWVQFVTADTKRLPDRNQSLDGPAQPEN